MKRKTLKNLVYAGAFSLLSLLPNLGFGQSNYKTVIEKGIVTFANKEEGEKAMKEHKEKMNHFHSSLKTTSTDLPNYLTNPMYGLNYFVPAHSPDFATNKNFYGSGDMNKDGIVNEEDYTYSLTQPVSFNPFNDGTHGADINLNGQAFDSGDKQMLREYLDGLRTHLNMWELETKTEQENHLEKALAIDPTNNMNGEICYNFNGQLFINFRGIYDIENSPYGNGEFDFNYDITHNGIWRIPMGKMGTETRNKVAHAINFVYIAQNGNEDVKNLNYKIKIEPQTDEMFYENSNFSMDPNEYAKETWYGYFNNFFGITYGEIPLYEHDLNNGIATITNPNGNIATIIPQSWNPFDDTGVEGKSVKYPADKNLENVSGIEDIVAEYIETEEPSDLLYYNETQVKKTASSNRTTDGVGKYNFDVDILYELTAGAYNPQNTPGATGHQKITVRDTEPPVYNATSKTWSDASGSPVTVTTRKDTTNQSCDGLVGKANEYKKGKDVTGNALEVLVKETNYDNRIMPVYVSSPANIEYLGNPNGANPLPSETGVPVWSHPTGNVVMHYSDQIVRESYGEKDIKRTFNGTSTRSDCEISPDTAQIIYVRSGVGVDPDENKLEKVIISNDGTKVSYVGEGRIKLDTDVYSIGGQLIKNNDSYYLNKGESKTLPIYTGEKGLQLIKVEDVESSKYAIKKIIKK